MYSKLKIRNFKSIKELNIDLKRINIFIGEPNAGKTNILESLFPFSINGSDRNYFKEILRFTDSTDLFYDQDYTKGLSVQIDQVNYKISQELNDFGAIQDYLVLRFNIEGAENTLFKLNFNAELGNLNGPNFNTSFRYYKFKENTEFHNSFRTFLDCPFGSNLPQLIIQNPKLRSLASEMLADKGFRLIAKPKHSELQVGKEVKNDLFLYPYQSLSDTMRRIIFLKLAIASNQKSVLIFDEPESNTFPFYTKEIGEMIADDISNQYFITTHSPYLLRSIIEKVNSNHLAVNLVYMKDYETRIRSFTKDELSDLLDDDIFFNIDQYLE